MSVTSVAKDFDRLTFTLIADFDAPIQRVWQLWADPRQLERWWGPPSHPATVETHDLTPGGAVTYFMTGPQGEKSRGWWRITSVNPPKSLEFTDGSADHNGTPVAGMPTTTVRSEEHTSELQSRPHLVCRLLLEKKKQNPLTLILHKKLKSDNKPRPDTLSN